ncbi:UDP-N,N'-diacetylbacillosamine 2-epimerase (hydrolyzing) [Roseobacter cerasinus]|uniref:UDP-N,N'-diacetylbacillosamine 2-epimerase (Hydrolyzing) n=1 Tax=Roseobacter cerasinus TaxID=2602289 RepID=A0A640VUH5_9RHOB|nr:UDP-N-acetylglucosamine 2-epimerase [Roseobacter cerasinus]GFE51060.1 UDP-N,N'-diacetylbacillosamine 2-epimerase (hydrolyzing) [Roseobacter cerasinus]
MLIHYVTGSRADFGLVESCLKTIDASTQHDVEVIVTGQHLIDKYGHTTSDIERSGLRMAAQIPVALSGRDGHEMAHAMASELAGFADLWKKRRPALVLVLGDRGEMLAAAIAAVNMGIHIAHIHGGERSGTIDESYRHAISKLSHIHFPATEDAAARLAKMGEHEDRIVLVGAPGLVGLTDGIRRDPIELRRTFELSASKPIALVVFHPVVQEQQDAGAQIEALLGGLHSANLSAIILRPNSDAGGDAIDRVLDMSDASKDVRVCTHLRRRDYLKTMASCDLVIGNSSSGIIESASFSVPCVNIGSRQNNRQRNSNTIDCLTFDQPAILKAIDQALELTCDGKNVYGDGRTDTLLLSALNEIEFFPEMLSKQNSY